MAYYKNKDYCPTILNLLIKEDAKVDLKIG